MTGPGAIVHLLDPHKRDRAATPTDPGAKAYDATVDPHEVIHLELGGKPSGVAEYVCGEFDRLMAQRDSLLAHVEALEADRETLAESNSILIEELEAEQAATRRATYTAAALFCVLCWVISFWAGWVTAPWLRRMLAEASR